MMEDQQIELKSEYLDEDYSEETTRHQRKTTKIKIKKQLEPKLGKYSLSAEDFEDEPQGTEADFELYEVVEESASKINAGDVGGNTTHDDDYAEDEAEEDEAVEDEEVEDEEVEDEEVEDEADCEDQNETYIIENKKEQAEESDVGDEEEPDEELVIEQESQCRGIRALARQNKRLQDRHDTLTQRFIQLESNLQTLHPTMPTTKILWPVTDIDALKSLEERLRTEQGMEETLKKKFKSGNHKSLNSFISTNLKALFYHAGRFTWTGEAASNAKHGKETHKAQGLLCVQALVDSCEDVFGECAQNITSAIAERLIRMNEAKHRLEIKAAGGCSKKLFTGQLASIPANKAASNKPGSLKKSTDERKSIAAPPRVSAINTKARGGTSAGNPASDIPASKIAARGETSAAIPTSFPVSNVKARERTSASQPNSNASSYHHGSGRKRKSSYTGEPNYVTARGGTSVGHSSSIIMAGNVFVPGGVSYPTSGIVANNIMLRGGTSAGNVITGGGSIADLPISANHHRSSKKPPIKFSGIHVIRNDRTSAGTVVTIPGGQRVSYAFPRNETNTGS